MYQQEHYLPIDTSPKNISLFGLGVYFKNVFHTTFSQDSHIFPVELIQKNVQKSLWNLYWIFVIIHNVMAISKDRHMQRSNIGPKQVT